MDLFADVAMYSLHVIAPGRLIVMPDVRTVWLLSNARCGRWIIFCLF